MNREKTRTRSDCCRPTFEDYVEGAVRPFLLSGHYVGERRRCP